MAKEAMKMSEEKRDGKQNSHHHGQIVRLLLRGVRIRKDIHRKLYTKGYGGNP